MLISFLFLVCVRGLHLSRKGLIEIELFPIVSSSLLLGIQALLSVAQAPFCNAINGVVAAGMLLMIVRLLMKRR